MAYRLKGWHRDRDRWLVRRLRPGDAPASFWTESNHGFSNHGFISNGKVYAREQEHADAYDKAATSGSVK